MLACFIYSSRSSQQTLKYIVLQLHALRCLERISDIKDTVDTLADNLTIILAIIDFTVRNLQMPITIRSLHKDHLKIGIDILSRVFDNRAVDEKYWVGGLVRDRESKKKKSRRQAR